MGTMMQQFQADKYIQKRLRLTGYLKLKNVKDWCGLWMRVDGIPGRVLNFDNMFERGLKGTAAWQQCCVVLDVPAEAKKVAIGVILVGSGKVWLSDLKVETVGSDVTTTSSGTLPPEPVNLDFKNP